MRKIGLLFFWFVSPVAYAQACQGLVNCSFETPALIGYQYNPTAAGIGWTFSSSSGIQRNGSTWGAAKAPDGVQTAFVQGTGTLSQAISLGAGTYTLSFQAAGRYGGCCTRPNIQPIKIAVNGTQVGSLITPPDTSFGSYSVIFTAPTSGTYTITFSGTVSVDKTTFIDAVSLSGGGRRRLRPRRPRLRVR